MGFKCPYCPHISPTLYGLKIHVKYAHIPAPRCEIVGCGQAHPTAQHYIRRKGHEAYAYFYTLPSNKRNELCKLRKKNFQNIAYETFKIKI